MDSRANAIACCARSTLLVNRPGRLPLLSRVDGRRRTCSRISSTTAVRSPGAWGPAGTAEVCPRAQGQLTGQEWNDRAVAFWKNVPADRVRSEFARNADLLIERAQLRTDDEMTSEAKAVVPWAYDAPLWQFVGDDTFLHEWPAHAEQMEAAR